MIRIVLVLAILLGSIFADNKDLIPKNFYPNKEALSTVISKNTKSIQGEKLNNVSFISYFGAMIEHESCITLTNPRCWSPSSELLTKWKNGKIREQGVGLGQITRAYGESGLIRLDVLTDLKKRYPRDLAGLTWDNIKVKPDLQIVAISLLWLDSYKRLPNGISEYDKVAFADSAYNGGYGFIIKDRKACGLKRNCDPTVWFNNVELINNRGTKILYGTRTANDINRHHVRDVLLDRWDKYYKIDWD